jgi:hypothetical protein
LLFDPENAPNTGLFDWTAAGAVSDRARIRVTSVSRRDLSQTSPAFAIANR